MKVPEKIYIDTDDNLSDSILYGFVEKDKDDDIEYVRKDVFIEKACKFFEPYIPDNSGGYDRVLVLENFKKYMEGE